MANTTNWLNISATSGSSGETILTLSANKNLSLYDKRAEITAYNPVYNISAKTYVTIQSFAPIIELSPAIIGVPDTGGTFELNISANCAWVISFPDLVSSYSTSAGTGNATVTLTVPGTSADTTLVGNIVVTAEGGQMSKTARIEQYGQGVQLSVSHSEILFPDSGAVRYFTVTANCVYDVSVVSGDWAVVSPQSGYTGVSSFTVTVDGTNTGTTTREGIVRISAPGVTRYIMLYQNPKETRLTAYYNATSTTNPTELYEVGTGFSKAETPDGTVIPGDSYIFPDTGSNRVFYTMTGTSIPANTFSGMSALTSVVIPDNITAIGQGAFRDCVNLTSVTIPDTVTVLPDNCFSGCSSLTAIPISESVTYIGEGCFAGCTGIETVTIPTGVTGIGAGCFSGSGVETIYANSPTPATIGNGAFTSGNLQDIIVPCAFFDAYKTAWSAYEEYMSCQDDEQLYFTTDTSNVKGTGETRTITILNTNIIQNRIGLTLPSSFPAQGSYTVSGNVIYLTYPANPSSTSTRTWTITVRATTKSGKDLSGSYRITQNANVVYSIPYTADTSTVTKSGETRTITIDTSGLVESSITIGVEGATGVTTTYQNGVITVTFPENLGYDRNITITVDAVNNNGNLANATIVFTQESGFFLVVETTYFVTSTTENTQILYDDGRSQFSSARLEDGTNVPIATGFTFPATGLQKVYYTLLNNTLADSSFGKYVSVGGTHHRAFQSKLYSIIVPEGVVSIGKGCFQGCEYLTNVVLPNSLTTLGENAFYSAGNSGYNPEYRLMNYMTVTMPDSITSIGKACFFLSGLKEAHLGTGITFIPELCFGKCNLQSLYIPDSVTGVGETNSTYGSPIEGGMKWIRLSKNTRYYPYSTFARMTGLKAIVAARNTAFYADNPKQQDRFSSVFSKGGTLYYPCEGNYSGWYGGEDDCLSAFSWTMQCFNSESGLTTTLPISFSGEKTALAQTGETRTFKINGIGYQHTYNVELQGIPGSTYSMSGDVLAITVPNNTTSTPRIIRAFVTSSAYNGELLGKTEIIITQEGPNGDTGSTSGLTGYTQNYLVGVFDVIQTSEPTIIANNIGSTGSVNYIYKVMIDDTEIPLSTGYTLSFTFPTTGRKTVKCYPYGDLTNSKLPGDYYYESIGYVFQNCDRLVSAIIPNTVKLYAGNFKNCTNLTSVTIPDTIEQISLQEFLNCTSLQHITLPSSLVTLEGSAFEGCSALTGITFPASVTTLGKYAFANCSSLSSLTVPASLTDIGSYCFSGCSSVTGVTFQGTTPPTCGNKIFGYNNNFPISVPCVSFDAYVHSFKEYDYYKKMVCSGSYKFPFWNYDDSTVPASGETREITLSLSGISEYLEDLQIIGSSVTLSTDAVSGVTVSYRQDPNDTSIGYADITFSPNTGAERTVVFTAQGDTSDGGTAVGTLTFTQTGTS